MGTRWTEEDLKKLRPGMVSGITTPAPEVKKVTPQQAMQALGRLPAGKMNNTERRYADQLELQKAAGDVAWWAFEPLNLRLGIDCFYKIDFLVMKGDGALEVHEVKGHWTDDALVKIKVAAAKFPFKFIAIRWVKSEWEYRYF